MIGMLCLQLIWSTVVELAASDWQPPRGKGNKGHQQNVQAAITGEALQAGYICPSADSHVSRADTEIGLQTGDRPACKCGTRVAEGLISVVQAFWQSPSCWLKAIQQQQVRRYHSC